jgi:hypothetical protein
LKTCGIAGKTLFLQRLNEIIYIRYGQKRIYELGEAHKVSPYYGKYSHCNLYSSWTFVNMAAITPSKIVAIHLKAIKIETIYVNKKKSPARLCVGDDVLNKDSLNSKAKRDP